MTTSSGSDQGSPAIDATPGAIPCTGLPEEVAESVCSFVETFRRWSQTHALGHGPSYPRLRLLYELHCEGAQKMADLADGLDVTPRNVTALVDGLEGEGLVRRRAHPTDRRVTMVELTEQGASAGELFQTYRAGVSQLFAALSDADQATLLRITRSLEERMRTGE